MAYKEIVVYLDPASDMEHRLDFAVGLAASQGARLVGLDVCSDAAFQGAWRDRAVTLSDLFQSTIRARGVRGVYRDGARGERNGVVLQSHQADLLIAPQPDGEAREVILPAIPEGVLLSSGVPVLLFPSGWRPRPVGDSVIIAWKASREATRAVHDAMPLLKGAKQVTVFTFDPETGEYGREPDLLVDHLREHGVSARACAWPDSGELTPVEALFAAMDAEESDLIVAGAYGHSRLLEGLFGGVSVDLMRNFSLPILMSH